MRKWKCDNCEFDVEGKLEFCPQCGLHREAFKGHEDESSAKHKLDYNAPQELPIEVVVRGMAKNIATIKNIMVFFTVLWTIGVIIALSSLSR